MFHSNALLAGISPALVRAARPSCCGAGSRPRAACPTCAATASPTSTTSASRSSYILATPERRRRRRQPAAGRVFGNEANPWDIERVRPALRVPGRRRVRLVRGRRGDHPDARHAVGRARRVAGGHRDPRPRHRRRVPAGRVRRRRALLNPGEAIGEIADPVGDQAVRGLLPQRRGRHRAGARRVVLDGRPRATATTTAIFYFAGRGLRLDPRRRGELRRRRRSKPSSPATPT